MKTLIKILASGMLCGACFSTQLLATDNIGKYAAEIPGIGLISDSIEFEGITISQFSFENDKKYIFVKPGEAFSARMHYSIDADALKALHRHHLIIGLHNDGPQECILHCYGILDAEGDACVTMKAPAKPGAYQVRFCHSIGLTDEEAQKAWWKGDGPSAKTIVGIVVVE